MSDVLLITIIGATISYLLVALIMRNFIFLSAAEKDPNYEPDPVDTSVCTFMALIWPATLAFLAYLAVMEWRTGK